MSAQCACGNTHHPGVPTPTNYHEMQAVTTIINPATVGKDEEKVLVFQSLKQNGTLGFEQLPAQKTELKSQSWGSVYGNYDENPSPLTPVLKYKSNLVSLVINDIVHVYGVAAHTGAISLLSPVFQRLGQADVDKDLRGKIAGCGNGKDKGWIYFQRFDKAQSKYLIYEKSLNKVGERPVEVKNTDNSKKDTDMVAFFDGKRRWVAYQSTKMFRGREESNIQLVCVDAGASDNIPSSAHKIDNQLVEFSACNAVRDGKNKIFIYFRGQGDELFWSASETADGKISFSEPLSLTEQTILTGYASLSVLPAAKGIMIYCIKDGGEGLEAFLDPWA
ncbi:uncharacterized protein B0J16DRAFT_370102 [Fusarium flagelliforme]|uniref:uncharacterized protein n=1 Tax=Fusarium flagelliforme TaxID=2675880 RepID=UPI001E8CB63E|nr:uncharacterized protein B0J16DRAFT_370102 [Fusarium flagelliforme]KAH7188099.1 hypothetical protein B0J16DRAFT_370102 [Fusarium flagelliforme]